MVSRTKRCRRSQNTLAEAAQERYLASAYGRQAMPILLVSQVAEQYLALLSYGKQLETDEATLEAARESYRIVRLRYDTGAASELDASWTSWPRSR